jgi:hypothetical protein
MEINNIINAIFYILTFVITFNYIRKWNDNMQQLDTITMINNK